jgi:uncharacterized membrane protein
VIPIRYLRNKLLFIFFLLIGVIFIIFGVIQLNAVYADSHLEDQFFVPGIVPFYWMIILIGGIIIITLIYVGIRKFIGQKQRDSQRKRDK